ncbi:MAG: translation initiation factor IF-2 [Ignavibacteriales bacterium]|mgnify:CR=1 FL=1|nr:MAG: translation initiation factor IF-2 [Ignavibacteriaceae bacterium]MBW7873100.1 translation initiation factor IF-2 [Ignavibacteria bacterium]MCZ2142743.1 translation initiation factor IF-2 [Ignavibacteriales bacterium]OQY77134.1 MAG: translation initiation factor IF-2 [Ignavibacteriales bacterium UTCHB3]MBV6443837.1 Elongation factor 4 [Ignavibacteriaceae bacterium]
MSEKKDEKIRIHNFASQFNISANAILDHLKKKGHNVKTVNSLLTPEMIEEVKVQFKKDMERSEKHYQKLEEFNKKFLGGSEPQAEEPKVAEEKPEEPKAVEGKDTESKPSEEKVSATEVQPAVQEVAKVEETEKKPDEVVAEVQPATEVSEAVTTIATDITPATDKQAETEEKARGEGKEPAKQTWKKKLKEKEEQETVSEAPEDTVSPEIEALIKPDEVETEEKTKEETGKRTPRRFDVDPRTGKRLGLKILGKMPEKEPQPEATASEPSAKTPLEKTTPVSTDSDDKKGRKKKKKNRGKKREEIIEETAPGKRIKGKKIEIDEKEVRESIRKTMQEAEDSVISSRASLRKKKRKERQEIQERLDEQKRLEEKIIKVNQFMSVSELANVMNVQVSEVISKCIALGLMVSINQRIELDTITLVADEFGYEIELEEEYSDEALLDTEDDPEDLESRSPVVTIMGHVDHGKTSLLDYIRSANVVAGESGGITQHIGAYKVEVKPGHYITFLDTPGHEAFTAMRARGAQVTDIVILIVAADDAVMPQTVEAISHAQAANVPIIVAINKIDKPAANIEKIKQQLAERNVLIEEWGGRYQSVEISAKKGLNIDLLLEKILLEAELLDLKANPNREARGVVIESQLDKGRGVTATILIQKGTLRQGDIFVCGNQHGRVRAMFDERNNKLDQAPPSTPVLVLGFEGAPQAGDQFIVVETERIAREIALKRQQLKRELDSKQVKHITLDEISRQIQIGGVSELPVIVKADVDGSVEAVSDSLLKLSTEEVKVKVIHKGVGAISESDVLLANASNAIIIGFHVRPNMSARKLAETQNVDIRIYSIIYDAINEVKQALEGMLSPILSEEITATVEIRDTFKVPKVGTVAGCYVLDGKITRNDRVRVVRDGLVIFTGEILSLKRFKDDVKEVDSNYECGISIQNFNDLKVGDIIEGFKVIETKKKLD